MPDNAWRLFDRDTLEEIYIELREGALTVHQIAKEFGISVATLSNINSGKYYMDPMIKYPIRERGKDNPRRRVDGKPEPGIESQYWNHHYPESWDIRSK